MTYDPLNLPDNAIPEGADITHIEEGMNELSTSLAPFTDPLYFNSVAEIVDYVDNSLTMYQIVFCHISGSTMTELGGVSGVSKGIIAKSRNVVGAFDFVFWVTYGTNLYFGRYDNGTINLRSVASSSVSTTSIEPEDA